MVVCENYLRIYCLRLWTKSKSLWSFNHLNHYRINCPFPLHTPFYFWSRSTRRQQLSMPEQHRGTHVRHSKMSYSRELARTNYTRIYLFSSVSGLSCSGTRYQQLLQYWCWTAIWPNEVTSQTFSPTQPDVIHSAILNAVLYQTLT